MNKQPPLVQAITTALIAGVALTALHFFWGTHSGGRLVYVFIAVVTLSGFILTFMRARAVLHPEQYEAQGKFLQSNLFLALTFGALLAYFTAFSAFFTLEPGESLIHGLGLALAPAVTITIIGYRKSRRLANAFWPTFAMVIAIVIGSAGVAWALEKFV